VTLTYRRTVRHFVTVAKAVRPILQVRAVGGQGEVFAFDMCHPVRIIDLAYDLIRLARLTAEQDILKAMAEAGKQRIRERYKLAHDLRYH